MHARRQPQPWATPRSAPTRSHEPDDVLAAVLRLEAELDDLKTRARTPDAPIEQLLREMRTEAAEERRAVVEDMQIVVDLIASSWRRIHQQIDALGSEVRELRLLADRALQGATVELRLGPGEPEGHEPAHRAPVAREAPAYPVNGRGDPDFGI